MALNLIRRRLDEDYDALHLLDSLPSSASMKWIPYSGANPPEALVIGTEGSRDILAFLMQHGDKPREVRYCSAPVNGPVNLSTTRSLSQDDVMSKPLYSPFKYNADQSKSCKRKSSILFKWYFMLRGLWTDEIQGNYSDYCKRFHDALRKIQAGQDAEQGRQGLHRSEGFHETSEYIEESSEPDAPDAPGSSYRLRSSQVAENGESARPAVRSKEAEQLATPAETLSNSEQGSDTDYHRLRRYLEEHNVLYLLDNIPDAAGLEFVDQRLILEAQPKKLFIGRHAKSDDEIYAYMKRNRTVGSRHEINFWVQDPRRPHLAWILKSEDVAKQHLLHPFNKTCPKNTQSIEQGDRARLTLMVKWYFVAAGIANNIVLRETKAYPERLRSALEYIAMRMGPAAVEPPEERTTDSSRRSQHAVQTSSQTPFDESRIQSDLAATPQPDATPPRPPASIVQPGPSPRGTKRTAEDAHFDNLSRILEQDRSLTKQVNNVDAELELLDIEKQNFMEDWEARQKEVLERRRLIDGKRSLVRKQFKRESMATAGE